MKRIKKTFTVILAVLISSIAINAQEEEDHRAGPDLSGYIETSYNYNFGKGMTNSLRSYDAKANQILLNNAHFGLSGSPSDKVSYVVEFDFGTDASVHGLVHQGILGSTSAVAVDIQEAYATYAFSDKFTFTGGEFVTFQGIEVIEGPSNPTISRGYLYGLAEAFTHVGGYLSFIPSDIIDLKFGVVNGWDLLVDNNADKSIISRLGVNLGAPLSFGISYYAGVEQENSTNWRNSLDLTGVTNIIPNIPIYFQGNYGMETVDSVDATWLGFGIQPVIALSKNIDLGLRAEYFADENGARTGVSDLNAFNFTIVPAFKFDAFTFRLEYRFDNANSEIFVEENGTAKNSSTVSLAVTLGF